jgi:hypothetical protein
MINYKWIIIKYEVELNMAQLNFSHEVAKIEYPPAGGEAHG